MAIASLDSANSPSVGSYTLLIGRDMPLYLTAAGFFTGAATGPVFGMPPQSSIPRGTLWVQAVPNAAPGATGAISLQLIVSFDGGVTFQATGAAVAAWAAGVGTVISFNVSGLGGNGQLALVASGVTLGTATGFNIYAHLG
jgi:hypothetical protein